METIPTQIRTETATVISTLSNPGLTVSLEPKIKLNAPANIFSFSPDGKWIAAATGLSVYLFDAVSGELIKEIAIPPSAGLSFTSAIAFSPDSSVLALGRADETLQVWDLAQAVPALSIKMNGAVGDIEHSPDGKYLAAIGFLDGSVVELLEARTGKQLRVLGELVNDLAFSPNQALLATAESVTGGSGYFVQLRDLDNLAVVKSVFPLRLEATSATDHFAGSVAFSRNGRFLAIIVDNRQLRIWDLQGNEEVEWPLKPEADEILNPTMSYWQQVIFSPQGYLAIIDQNGRVLLLATETGELLGKTEVAQATRIAFAPNGEGLLVGGLNADLTLFTVGESR
ncbi:MAG: WD40 repeat domain-containing protein [Gemmatales bacterium]|nr:WD40 repeat domain-containing protein [Gemmatales bacterium]